MYIYITYTDISTFTCNMYLPSDFPPFTLQGCRQDPKMPQPVPAKTEPRPSAATAPATPEPTPEPVKRPAEEEAIED